MNAMKNGPVDPVLIFKALAHPARLQLLRRLMEQECCVSEVEKCLRISQPNVSQHLRVLRTAGVISGSRWKTRICYRIADERVRAVLDIFEKGNIRHEKRVRSH
jgi:DNA-binding transcriptional ArsR family regulator